MKRDANFVAKTHGRDGLRREIDAPKPKGWHFIGDHEFSMPSMLVKGAIPDRGVLFIGGQSGSGKSFVAIDLLVSLASGTPFFGRQVTRCVGGAIIAAEGADMLGNRIMAAARERGIALADLPIAWRGDAPPLKSAKDVERLGDELRVLDRSIIQRYRRKLGIVVLDTVAATFDLEDEDKNSEVAKAIRVMRDLAESYGGLIGPVHHYGKTAATGLRGGSAWRAGADVVLSVLAERNEMTGEVKGRELALAKVRDGVEGPIARFDLRFTELGVDGDGDPVGTCIVVPKTDEPSLHPGGQRRGRAERCFRDAFLEAMADAQAIKVRHDGPLVQAVDLIRVRQCFQLRYATAEDDVAKRSEAQRKAFARTLDKLSGEFATWVSGERSWIWSTSQS